LPCFPQWTIGTLSSVDLFWPFCPLIFSRLSTSHAHFAAIEVFAARNVAW
jgi:hypothetical protein